MSEMLSVNALIEASYFVTAVLFILGLKRMSSPVTARSGILWAGAGMLVATAVTFLYPGMSNYDVGSFPPSSSAAAFACGAASASPWTDMPQMIALYNGMGGGAAAGYRRRRALSRRDGRVCDFHARGRGRHHRCRLLQR